MRVGLVVYGGLQLVSGGFLYDRMLVRALEEQGVTVPLTHAVALPHALLVPLSVADDVAVNVEDADAVAAVVTVGDAVELALCVGVAVLEPLRLCVAVALTVAVPLPEEDAVAVARLEAVLVTLPVVVPEEEGVPVPHTDAVALPHTLLVPLEVGDNVVVTVAEADNVRDAVELALCVGVAVPEPLELCVALALTVAVPLPQLDTEALLQALRVEAALPVVVPEEDDVKALLTEDVALPHTLPVLLDELEAATASGPTDLFAAADHLAEKLPRRSLVCLFSDFFDDRAEALKRLLALRARKHDVAIFHLVDPAELTFPYDDPTLFTSMEGNERIEVNPREIKDSYLEEFGRFLEATRTACTAADCDYERVRTDEPLDGVLLRFLARRGGRL
jgi:hypothetical protein